jgi:hypothetical protein
MKTVASSTKNESPELEKVKAAIKATALYLSQWTEQQVHQFSIGQKTPYIWPLGDLGYVVGRYRVLNDRGIWQLRNSDNQLIQNFSDKLSAVFYTLCYQSQRYNIADSISLADAAVLRLRNDIQHYESSVKRAKIAKKFDSADIWTARLFDARLQLRDANNQLQKSLSHAKYIKYWE